MTDVLKYAEKNCIGQIGSLQFLTSEKCTVPLKEGMATSGLRKIMLPTAERISQRIGECKFSCQNKYSSL